MEWIGIFRIIYFLGFINSIFFSFLIFSKKKKSLADKILGYWLIALSIQLLYPFFYLYNIHDYYKYMGYEASITILHPLFLFFYTISMTNQLKFKMNWLIGLIPSLIFIISIPILISSFINNDELLVYMYHFNFFETFSIKELGIMFLIMGLMSFVFFFFLYKSYQSLKYYRKEVLHIYSYKDNVDLLWLRRLVLYFTLSYLFVSLMVFVFSILKISLVFIDFLFYSSLVMFVFLLAYYGYQQGRIFSIDKTQSLYATKKKTKTSLIEQNQSNIAIKLKKLMHNEKPYLIPNLTIHDLANKLNIPAHQLSKIIHKELGKNFFEYINEFRILHFKKCLKEKEYKDYTLLGIALECGFNSKSAFNRIFKEYTGQTPGNYKKTL